MLLWQIHHHATVGNVTVKTPRIVQKTILTVVAVNPRYI